MANNYPAFIPWPQPNSERSEATHPIQGFLCIGDNYDETIEILAYPEANELELHPYHFEETPYKLSIFSQLDALTNKSTSALSFDATIWNWGQQEQTIAKIEYNLESSQLTWVKTIDDPYLAEYIEKIISAVNLIYQNQFPILLIGERSCSYSSLCREHVGEKIENILPDFPINIWFIYDKENSKHYVISHVKDLLDADGDELGYKAEIYDYENNIFPLGTVIWKKGDQLKLWPSGCYPGIHKAFEGKHLPSFLQNLTLS